MITIQKIRPWLISVFLIALLLPAYAVRAQTGTTVEINHGNTITLQPDGSLESIPLDINDIVVSSEAQGLAAFDFTISWDAKVIRVHKFNVTAAAAERGFSLTMGTVDNVKGSFNFVSSTVQTPYSKASFTLAYLGITARGKVGDNTSLSLTITNLTDNKLQEITPRTAVNAPVEIGAGTSLPQASLVSIKLEPGNPSISSGSTRQFTATGTYTNNNTADITGSAAWSSSNLDVATISSGGLATCLAAGTTTITAALGTISVATTLIVTKAEENPVTSPPEKETVTPPPPPATPPPGEIPGTVTPPGETKTPNVPPAELPAAPATPPAPPSAPATLPFAINWVLVGGIAAGVVILGLVLFLLLRR